VKKALAVILLISLLAPSFMPLVAIASGKGPAMSGEMCGTGGGDACMEGDRCTLNHRQCGMHAAEKKTGNEMRVEGGHHHGGGVHGQSEGPPDCAVFYSCGADNGPEALSLNPLETPFLLSTHRFGAALAIARPFSAGIEAYSGPFLPYPQRPPSITL